MNFILPVIVTSALCLLLVGAILVLTLYLIVRKGRETLSDISSSSPDAPVQTSSSGADTRWARGDLKTAPGNPTAADHTRTCLACGAPNPPSAGVCSSCGRVL